MSSDIQLRVEDLRKEFGAETAVSDVSFQIKDNEIVALLGPSGCGKTTTLRCIAGVDKPTSGEISINDNLVNSETVYASPENRGIGMVYQNYAIWPHKTVYENVVFPLKYADHGFSETEHESRVDELLTLVEIAELKNSRATDLSDGQQQRTALARSLVHDPDLLLMDEPLSNRDRELRTSMRYELQKLQHEFGVSILYVTHDQEEAFYLADRVLVMRNGEIIERGDPAKLYDRPQSAFTRGFVGQWDQFDGKIRTDETGSEQLQTIVGKFPLTEVDVISRSSSSDVVSCFLRPTDVQISDANEGQDGTTTLVGDVIAEGVLGEFYELTVALEEGPEVIVQTKSRHDYTRGQEVELRVDPSRLKVY